MSTHLDLLRLRAEQATATREHAEQTLLALAFKLNPRLAKWPPSLALQSRALETLIEHPSAHRSLVRAHSAYRRAANAERKAKSAAHRARFEPIPAPPEQRQRRRRASLLRQAVQAFAEAA